jgi:hypothetical protein
MGQGESDVGQPLADCRLDTEFLLGVQVREEATDGNNDFLFAVDAG